MQLTGWNLPSSIVFLEQPTSSLRAESASWRRQAYPASSTYTQLFSYVQLSGQQPVSCEGWDSAFPNSALSSRLGQGSLVTLAHSINDPILLLLCNSHATVEGSLPLRRYL